MPCHLDLSACHDRATLPRLQEVRGVSHMMDLNSLIAVCRRLVPVVFDVYEQCKLRMDSSRNRLHFFLCRSNVSECWTS